MTDYRSLGQYEMSSPTMIQSAILWPNEHHSFLINRQSAVLRPHATVLDPIHYCSIRERRRQLHSRLYPKYLLLKLGLPARVIKCKYANSGSCERIERYAYFRDDYDSGCLNLRYRWRSQALQFDYCFFRVHAYECIERVSRFVFICNAKKFRCCVVLILWSFPS